MVADLKTHHAEFHTACCLPQHFQVPLWVANVAEHTKVGSILIKMLNFTEVKHSGGLVLSQKAKALTELGLNSGRGAHQAFKEQREVDVALKSPILPDHAEQQAVKFR